MKGNMNKMESKKAALHNLGCKVNAYETEAMQQLLEGAGYEIVGFSEKADVYVINTCTVTNMADRKSRQMLHRAKKQNPDGIVVAAGCFAQAKTEEARAEEAVDIILGNNKKKDLIRVLEEYQAGRKKTESMEEISHGRTYEELFITKTSSHARSFLKIQDGCDQFCSYCIIPYVRGRARSRRQKDILEEISHLAQMGHQEIVFSGIHLSSYGKDTKESLLGLIAETAKIEGIKRIRLGSLEPVAITEEFAAAASKIDKLCPHFHLSLQSGCNKTLARMNRNYTAAEYQKSCMLLRDYFTHPAITTDVIVGFPGETEEEFAETKAFLKKIRFYEMHIFKYSRREGTKAAGLKEQVPDQKKAGRSAELIALGEEMSKEFREYYIGSEAEVLMEEAADIHGARYFIGYTREYVKIAVRTDQDLTNVLVRGKIVGNLQSAGSEAGDQMLFYLI